MLGRLFARLRGSSRRRCVRGEEVIHGDYRIRPEPFEQDGRWITAGVIIRDTPEGRREYRFVRADSHASAEQALAFSVTKARQIIDQLGDRLFDLPS